MSTFPKGGTVSIPTGLNESVFHLGETLQPLPSGAVWVLVVAGVVLNLIWMIGLPFYRRRLRLAQMRTHQHATSTVVPASQPSTVPSLETVEVGDRILINDGEYDVGGIIRVTDPSGSWVQYTLESPADRSCWLSVRYAPGAEPQLMFWRETPEVPLKRASNGLVFEDSMFYEVAGDVGRYQSEGTTGLKFQGSVEYLALKETEDGPTLLFQSFDDGEWYVCLGNPLQPSSVTVRPRPSRFAA